MINIVKPSRLFLTAAFLLTASFATAGILTTEPGTEKLEDVVLSKSASAGAAKMSFVGAGLRSKKVIMMNVKVYVAELFAANPASLKRTSAEALNSLPAAMPVAIQLHFLRDVDAAKVQSSFKEALEANKMDLKKPELQKLLDAVQKSGEAKKGKSLTIVGTKNPDGTETVTYEDSAEKATTVAGPAGFVREVFAIWLGEPSDDGVAKLKASLIKPSKENSTTSCCLTPPEQPKK